MAVTLISATVAAIGAGFAGAGAAATFSWAAAAIAFGTSLVMGVVGQALSPKPPDLGSFGEDFTRNFRQPTPERRIIYGECRAGGATAFIASTDDNKYLHLVIIIAGHEVEAINEIIINETSIANDEIDGNGNVNTGTFENKVRIKKHLGSTSQTADSDLVSEVTDWTTDHRLQGISYLYVRLQYDRDAFPSGIPNISAYVLGKKVLDTRDSVTRYTPNIALITRDYLTEVNYGFEAPATRIDTDVLEDSADNCDEIVTVRDRSFDLEGANATADTLTITGSQLFLQRGDRVQLTGSNLPNGLTTSTDYYVIPYKRNSTLRVQLATSLANSLSGTAINLTSTGTLNGTQKIIKQAEPRYYGGGVLKSTGELGKNLQEILSGMGGRAVYAGGVWKILSAQYYAPVYTFTENDLISTISVTTKKSKKDRFNRVRGTYTSPVNNGNESDYPYIENSTYQSEDGEVIDRDLPLPFSQRPSSAQRIAKIELERQRQEITFSASFKLTAFKVQAGDNLYFTFDRYGWSSKVFEVLEWALGIESNDNPTPVINMTLQENASGVYDWNNGEETTFDLAPNTNLPDPFTVNVVSGFSLDSILIDSQAGDKTYKVLATWDTPENSFITQGGFFEIEFKRTTETVYRSAGKVDGDINEMEIPQLQPDVLYDIRIRAFNNVRVKSAYTTINNFNIGDTATTDTEDWENETLARDGDDWENDTLSSEDWEA